MILLKLDNINKLLQNSLKGDILCSNSSSYFLFGLLLEIVYRL